MFKFWNSKKNSSDTRKLAYIEGERHTYISEVCTYCRCYLDEISEHCPKREHKYSCGSPYSCDHREFELCMLSQINEVKLVRGTPTDKVLLLVGHVITPKGLEELKTRLSEGT